MQAAWSGLDNEMCPPPSPTATLVASAKAGLIAMKYIDRAAGNNLREKFAARLFDTVNGAPGWFVNTTAAAAVADTPGDRALAYAVASEGVALLKNDVRAATGARVLPLALRAGTRVALLGPAAGCVAGERAPCLAETAMGGHYTSYGARIVTLVEAAGNASGVASVAHVVGANIDDDDESGVPAAVAAATAADVVIVAVGDSIPISTGSCSEMSDTDDTNLPGGQLALLDAVAAARGGDVVVVLFTCRPVTFGAGPQSRFGPNNALLDRLPAVVAGWRPGEEAGNAVWDILTGAVNPSGRLTQNWVRHVGAVKGPASPYLQARGALVKNYFSGDPATALFPFAWGMAYTNYTVTGAALTPGGDGAVVDADATLTVTGRIASAGPAGKVSLLLYYSQNAPTKWARFGTQLFAFGKFDVPADSAGTPFSFSARVRDMDAYEPATGDYEVFTGAYSVTLGTCATCPALAQWTVNVNGTYTWIWDYTV